MRFALVHDAELDGGKRRCARRSSSALQAGRGIAIEPDDAVKSHVARSRGVDSEPANALKGERGASGTGAIRC